MIWAQDCRFKKIYLQGNKRPFSFSRVYSVLPFPHVPISLIILARSPTLAGGLLLIYWYWHLPLHFLIGNVPVYIYRWDLLCWLLVGLRLGWKFQPLR